MKKIIHKTNQLHKWGSTWHRTQHWVVQHWCDSKRCPLGRAVQVTRVGCSPVEQRHFWTGSTTQNCLSKSRLKRTSSLISTHTDENSSETTAFCSIMSTLICSSHTAWPSCSHTTWGAWQWYKTHQSHRWPLIPYSLTFGSGWPPGRSRSPPASATLWLLLINTTWWSRVHRTAPTPRGWAKSAQGSSNSISPSLHSSEALWDQLVPR